MPAIGVGVGIPYNSSGQSNGVPVNFIMTDTSDPITLDSLGDYITTDS